MSKTVHWMLILLLPWGALTSCGDSSPPSFSAPPHITAGLHREAPLVVRLECLTDEPSRIVVRLQEGQAERELAGSSSLSKQHHFPVLGLQAGQRHTLLVEAIDASGNSTVAPPLRYTMPPLPDDFPPLSLRFSQPDRMEPGATLFEVRRMKTSGTPELYLFVAVNPRGEVIWYYRPDEQIRYLQVLPNNRLLYLVRYHQAVEIDLTGNVLRQWHASRFPNNGNPLEVPSTSIPVDAETFHHEILQMPSGNLLALSTELREVDNFPSLLEDPESVPEVAQIVADVVVEFQPDGSVVQEWSLLDLMDPDRYGYSSGGGYWKTRGYGHVEGGTRDWSHANSIYYDQKDDAIIVSVRHQDAAIKFSRATGKLIWILGTPAGWGEAWKPYLLEPKEELEWPFHQHAARLTGPGTLLLFDNGNHRSWPPEPPRPAVETYSRAVEYRINERAGRVEQRWSYGGPGPDAFFSALVSEADRLPLTNNVLITDGGRTRDDQGNFAVNPEATHYSARIFEITDDDPPEIVFDLVIEDTSSENPKRWSVYRSQRLPNFSSVTF